MDVILGIETGGTKVQAVLGLPDGTIIHRWRTKVDRARGSEGILEALKKEYPVLESKAAEMGCSIVKVGWGFGGPVVTSEGLALGNPLISGWSDFPLADYFNNITHLPVYIFNDTNAATWAEYCLGAGRGTEVFFYTNIGTGIGGGIVEHGRLYDGCGYGAVEFGQTYIGNPWDNDSFFRCERVENICSGTAMEDRLHAADIPDSSLLWELCGGDKNRIDCRMLGAAVHSGDEFATDFFDKTVHVLSIGLSNIISCFSPQKLAIGGGVSLIGSPLMERLNRYTKDYVFFNSVDKYQIVPCELGEDVVVVGSLLLAGEMP